MTNKELKHILINLGLCKQNKYLTKYVNLIITNLTTTKQLGYDKHHIIPKYYYKYNNLKINSSKENLVYLSRTNHILAHLYLCFCSTSDKYVYPNSYAVLTLSNSKYCGYKDHKKYINYDLEDFILSHKDELDKSAKIFSELQRKLNTGKRQSKETIQKRVATYKKKGIKPNLNKTGITYKGKYYFIPNNQVSTYLSKGAILGYGSVTEESKEKNRQSHLGKKLPHTKEWNEAISKASKGKKLSEECKHKISMTLKGNTEKCGHIRGKIAINNGEIYKFVSIDEFENIYKSLGWVKGIGNTRKINCGGNKNKIRINNENGAKYVTIDEWENKYSKEGWHRGYEWKK